MSEASRIVDHDVTTHCHQRQTSLCTSQETEETCVDIQLFVCDQGSHLRLWLHAKHRHTRFLKKKHLDEGTLEFMLIVSMLHPARLYFQETSYRTLLSASLLPHDQPIDEQCGLWVVCHRCCSCALRTRLETSTTLLGAWSPACASYGEIFIAPPPLRSTSFFARKVVDPFSVSLGLLCNWRIGRFQRSESGAILAQGHFLFKRARSFSR